MKESKVIVAGDISNESIQTLNEYNVEIIKTSKCIDVYNEISYHSDIQLIRINNNIIVAPNMYNEYINIFDNIDINYING